MAPKTAEKVAFLPLRDEFPPLSPALAAVLKCQREVRSAIANVGQAKAKADAEIGELQSRRRELDGRKMAATGRKLVAEAKGTTDPDALKDIDAVDAQLSILTAEIEKITREQTGRTGEIRRLTLESGRLTQDYYNEKRAWGWASTQSFDDPDARHAMIDMMVRAGAFLGGARFDHPRYFWDLLKTDPVDVNNQIRSRSIELERYLEEVPVDDA